MQVHRLETHVTLPRARPEVFAYFADAANLQELTPTFLDFRILTPLPIEMEEGTMIDYRLRIRGIPVRWRTRITEWDPPRRFVDEQLRGPYRLWVHEHRFRELNGQTEVIDRVRYAVPGGVLVQRLFVRKDVERIFEYRKRRLLGRFGGEP